MARSLGEGFKLLIKIPTLRDMPDHMPILPMTGQYDPHYDVICHILHFNNKKKLIYTSHSCLIWLDLSSKTAIIK